MSHFIVHHPHINAEDIPNPKPVLLHESRELTANEQAIQCALDQYTSGYGSANTAVIGQQIADVKTFTLVESGNLNQGWDSYCRGHLEPELKHFRDISYRIRLVSVEFFIDSAYAVFRFDACGSVSEKPVAISGLGTALLTCKTGDWKIAHLHTSVASANHAHHHGNHATGKQYSGHHAAEIEASN